jgi:hypothetical protein
MSHNHSNLKKTSPVGFQVAVEAGYVLEDGNLTKKWYERCLEKHRMSRTRRQAT